MLNVLYIAIQWLLSAVVLRVAVYGFLLLFVADFCNWIGTHLPNGDGGLGSAMSGLPSGTWYFLDLFNVPEGISMIFAAYITRFAIRRIPFFG